MTTKRRLFACRVYDSTPEAMDLIASEFNCYRINGDGKRVPSVGVLLDRIASGEIDLINCK